MATQGKRKRTSSSTHTRRRRKNNTGNSKKLAVYAGILIIGAAGIVLYNQYPNSIAALSSKPRTETVTAKSTNKKAFVEPDYQFYTLLPQGDTSTRTTTASVTTAKPAATTTAKVIATNTDTTNTTTASVTTTKPAATTNTPAVTSTTTAKNAAPIIAASPTASVSNHHYRLQLAAFKRYEDADELKAKLILQGYPTTINSANVNGTVWYRLSIGPYDTTQEAKSVQAKLEQTHLVSHTQVVQQ